MEKHGIMFFRPSKYIQIFSLLGWELPQVVTFPLSGLGQPERNTLTESEKSILDDYLKYVFKDYNIGADTKIAVFDYFSSNQTFKHISESMRRIYNHHLDIEKVDTHFNSRDYDISKDDQYSIMIEGDILNKRCVPKYNLLSGGLKSNINLLRCNVIISLVVLAVYGKLHREPTGNVMRRGMRKIPRIVMPELENGQYIATYYDISNNKITKGPVNIRSGVLQYGKVNSITSCIIILNMD